VAPTVLNVVRGAKVLRGGVHRSATQGAAFRARWFTVAALEIPREVGGSQGHEDVGEGGGQLSVRGPEGVVKEEAARHRAASRSTYHTAALLQRGGTPTGPRTHRRALRAPACPRPYPSPPHGPRRDPKAQRAIGQSGGVRMCQEVSSSPPRRWTARGRRRNSGVRAPAPRIGDSPVSAVAPPGPHRPDRGAHEVWSTGGQPGLPGCRVRSRSRCSTQHHHIPPAGADPVPCMCKGTHIRRWEDAHVGAQHVRVHSAGPYMGGDSRGGPYPGGRACSPHQDIVNRRPPTWGVPQFDAIPDTRRDPGVQHQPLGIHRQPRAGKRPVPHIQCLVPFVRCSTDLSVPGAALIHTQAEIPLVLHSTKVMGSPRERHIACPGRSASEHDHVGFGYIE
jgi:hypothetical protein